MVADEDTATGLLTAGMGSVKLYKKNLNVAFFLISFVFPLFAQIFFFILLRKERKEDKREKKEKERKWKGRKERKRK